MLEEQVIDACPNGAPNAPPRWRHMATTPPPPRRRSACPPAAESLGWHGPAVLQDRIAAAFGIQPEGREAVVRAGSRRGGEGARPRHLTRADRRGNRGSAGVAAERRPRPRAAGSGRGIYGCIEVPRMPKGKPNKEIEVVTAALRALPALQRDRPLLRERARWRAALSASPCAPDGARSADGDEPRDAGVSDREGRRRR